MKKPEKQYHRCATERGFYHYDADEMDAYIAHLESRIQKLGAAPEINDETLNEIVLRAKQYKECMPIVCYVDLVLCTNRIRFLEQARDEAKPLIEWAANSEFREFKNWLSKYGVDNGKT